LQQSLAIRRDVLGSLGAGTEVADEILRYNNNVFDHAAIDTSVWPLPDESFVATWRQYTHETDEACSIVPLTKYLVQLQFPIEAGISQSADYIAATRRGLGTNGMKLAIGSPLRAPGQCRITIHPTAAGHIPVLIAGTREDFVALVQALTQRNEPHPVPDSMGACIVSGYNNWHRISVLRNQFLASASADDSWSEEFARIKAQKDLYQDRFIILSTGAYSGVNACDIGLDHQEWLNLSLAIRREHECTHYFTRRVFSSMRNHLVDELVADYMGISAAAGRFRADWLLRFLGLESFPQYREGGRLQNYRGAPPLSDRAFAILQKLVIAAAANLEHFDRRHVPERQHSYMQPALLKVLTRLTVEEMASTAGQMILEDSFDDAVRAMKSSGPVAAGKEQTDHQRPETPNSTRPATQGETSDAKQDLHPAAITREQRNNI
jgi:uncharacterized protein DUF7005